MVDLSLCQQPLSLKVVREKVGYVFNPSGRSSTSKVCSACGTPTAVRLTGEDSLAARPPGHHADALLDLGERACCPPSRTRWPGTVNSRSERGQPGRG